MGYKRKEPTQLVLSLPHVLSYPLHRLLQYNVCRGCTKPITPPPPSFPSLITISFHIRPPTPTNLTPHPHTLNPLLPRLIRPRADTDIRVARVGCNRFLAGCAIRCVAWGVGGAGAVGCVGCVSWGVGRRERAGREGGEGEIGEGRIYFQLAVC